MQQRPGLTRETFVRDNRPTTVGWLTILGSILLIGVIAVVLLNNRFSGERDARLTAEGQVAGAQSALDQALARTPVANITFNPTVNPTINVYQPPAQVNVTQVAQTVVVAAPEPIIMEVTPQPTPDYRETYIGGTSKLYANFDDQTPVSELREGDKFVYGDSHFFWFRAPDGSATPMIPIIISLADGGTQNVYVDSRSLGIADPAQFGYRERIKLSTVTANFWAFGTRAIEAEGRKSYFVYPVVPMDQDDKILLPNQTKSWIALSDGDIIEIVDWEVTAPDYVLANQGNAVAVQAKIITHAIDDTLDGRDDDHLAGISILIPSSAINLVLEKPKPAVVDNSNTGNGTGNSGNGGGTANVECPNGYRNATNMSYNPQQNESGSGSTSINARIVIPGCTTYRGLGLRLANDPNGDRTGLYGGWQLGPGTHTVMVMHFSNGSARVIKSFTVTVGEGESVNVVFYAQ